MTADEVARLEPHERAVLQALEAAAADVTAAGLAAIDVDGCDDGWPTFNLIPAEPAAAPLRVQVDHEQQLTLYPGGSGMVYEEWSKKPEELLRAVRDAARAVIEGRYSEEVRWGNDGSLGKGRGWFAERDHKPRRISYSNFETFGDRGPWQRREYVPYGEA